MFGGQAAIASGTLTISNNDAHFVPVIFPCDATLYALRFIGANTTGNYDLGLYDRDLNLLASTGSTAMSAAFQTLTLADLRVSGGKLYYMALALSSTAGSIWRPDFGAAAFAKGIGFGTQSSALPLPSTATPSAFGVNVVPFFNFGVR